MGNRRVYPKGGGDRGGGGKQEGHGNVAKAKWDELSLLSQALQCELRALCSRLGMHALGGRRCGYYGASEHRSERSMSHYVLEKSTVRPRCIHNGGGGG